MQTPDTKSRIIPPTRRNFLAATTAAAAGLAATVQTSHGYLFRQSPPMSLNGLTQTWVRVEGEQKIQSYAKFLASLRLKYVTPLQVIQAHAKKRGSVWNTLPPRSMWRPMANTLKAVDRIAAIVGKPVKEVTSAYRSPAYNRRCPGAKSRPGTCRISLSTSSSQLPPAGSPPRPAIFVLRESSREASGDIPVSSTLTPVDRTSIGKKETR